MSRKVIDQEAENMEEVEREFLGEKEKIVTRSVKNKNGLVRKIFFLLWIALTIYLTWTFWQGRKASKDEAQIVLEKLSHHVLLENAHPTVATVSDAEKLKNTDPFYQRAQNGDKLVIWEEKALLYRPSMDKIIDFGVVVQNKQSDENKNNK